jgi:DNA repair photolyase
MSTIYEPAGKAREYSPLALNIYLSCTHHCKYCYAPRCRHQNEEQYFCKPYPRKGIIQSLINDLEKGNVPKKQVLLSFIGDVYCETMDDNRATREALETLLKFKVPVAILTKGGKRCLKDLDLFKAFGEHIQIGTTLTFDNDRDSFEWESGAALPGERLETLRTLHDNGIRTFASFEPVIVPEQSLNLMKKGIDFIDVYKVGKLNNYKGLDKTIDWTDFLIKALEILRPAGKSIYIKHDLRNAAPSVRLYGNEVLADEHNVI